MNAKEIYQGCSRPSFFCFLLFSIFRREQIHRSFDCVVACRSDFAQDDKEKMFANSRELHAN
jgi:hypothetical protein